MERAILLAATASFAVLTLAYAKVLFVLWLIVAALYGWGLGMFTGGHGGGLVLSYPPFLLSAATMAIGVLVLNSHGLLAVGDRLFPPLQSGSVLIGAVKTAALLALWGGFVRALSTPGRIRFATLAVFDRFVDGTALSKAYRQRRGGARMREAIDGHGHLPHPPG